MIFVSYSAEVRRGLLGSKAYVKEHKEELDKIVLNINLDMIGTYMGKFISCVSAEDKLAHYISYMAAEIGFPIEAKTECIPVILHLLQTAEFQHSLCQNCQLNVPQFIAAMM